MEYVLTIIMCVIVEGKTSCLPAYAFETPYKDGYECMLDGYTKAYDKIVELGRDDVNKYNIYIKFGCNENHTNKTTTSNIIIQ